MNTNDFLASLPNALREECRNRLTGSGFSPDHPVFQVLADFYEKNPHHCGANPRFHRRSQPAR
jgi:hypothetical protein